MSMHRCGRCGYWIGSGESSWGRCRWGLNDPGGGSGSQRILGDWLAVRTLWIGGTRNEKQAVEGEARRGETI